MDEQINNKSKLKTKSKILILILIVILAGGGYFVWNKYFSPEAKYKKQQKQYEVYSKWEKEYFEALKQDTYGGKTPQETLDLFVQALRAGDVDLASKYFVLDTRNSREEWKENLQKAKEERKLDEIINIVPRLIFDKNLSSDDTVWFILKNQDGLVEYSVILKLNQQSGVWKIESL